MKIKLLGKNLDELKRLVAEEGLPAFAARQIAQWLYVKKVRSIDEMTNLSKIARAKLSEKIRGGCGSVCGTSDFVGRNQEISVSCELLTQERLESES